MRIPLIWLKDYVKLPADTRTLTHRLTMAGHMLDKIEGVNGNTVIDLELRGNRADCYSILGIAREVSSLFNTPPKPIRLLGNFKRASKLAEVSLSIKTPLVKRVMMVVIKDIKITESPKWMTEKLAQYGIGSINNIVDLTNFVAVETGQPMHAFDLAAVGKNLEIRLAKAGEKMITFLGNELVLTKDDLVWAKKDAILSVAGAIGGRSHSISDTTEVVLLEAANYDRANIRRTVHRHNLFTDAGIRHEKDLDPNLVEEGILRFCQLVKENKWGKIETQIFDYYPKHIKPWKITLTYDYLVSLGGLTIAPAEVIRILESLNFEVTQKSSKFVEVLVPTYRTDVVVEEDLVEEILRITGYENIPDQTLSLEIPPVITPAYINQELNIKTEMYSLGFNELISLPFVSEKLVSKNAPLMPPWGSPIAVQNRPSPDFEYLRTSLLPNLLETTQKIINERGVGAQLYEIGKVYVKKQKEYIEKRRLGIISWSAKKTSFAVFKGHIEALFEKLNLPKANFKTADLAGQLLKNTYEVYLEGAVVGVGGQANSVFYVEIDLDAILGKARGAKARLRAKYPPQIEDITLHLPPRTLVGEVLLAIEKTDDQVDKTELVDIYKNAYTFRVWYQHPQKTLTDVEVAEVRSKIIKSVSEKFGAKIG